MDDEEIDSPNPFEKRAQKLKESSIDESDEVVIPSARARSDVAEFAPNYDEAHGYISTPDVDLPHFSIFNHNITSSEPDIS